MVDDEEKVRWIARRVLEADGWEVLEAADGQAALQLIGEREGRLDLVVTDLNMPRVSGRELAEVVSVFHPGLPVLGITGFLSAVSHDRRLPILPKPFSPGSLVQAVRMACLMRERFKELSAVWNKLGHELDLGIGIAQGYATLGAIGYEPSRAEMREYDEGRDLDRFFWFLMQRPFAVPTSLQYIGRLVERLVLLHECFEDALAELGVRRPDAARREPSPTRATAPLG